VQSKHIGWLAGIIERANLPQLTDLGGALIVYNNLTCSDVSEHTFRRFGIPFRKVGRERRYHVDHVIDYAREQLKAPVRIPPQRLRKKRIRAPPQQQPTE
jgi:hypothetical protein